MGGCGGEEVVGGRVVLSQCVKTQSYMWKKNTHVQAHSVVRVDMCAGTWIERSV